MPTIKVNGVNLFYKESGSGPETIVFSHGLLMDHSMFEPQRAVFEKQYRVIAYDHRAQGTVARSQARGYDMDTLADDAAAADQSSCMPLRAILPAFPWEALSACAWLRTIPS